jgi:hypothetical protein
VSEGRVFSQSENRRIETIETMSESIAKKTTITVDVKDMTERINDLANVIELAKSMLNDLSKATVTFETKEE